MVWPISTCFWVDEQGAVEKLDDVSGYGKTFRRVGGVGIGSRRVRDDCDAHCIRIGFGSTDISTACLDVALHAAEQVDLVGDFEPRIETGRRVGVAILAASRSRCR